MSVVEIRFHGRGGQGAVVAGEILALAAFKEGKYVSAFPYFGVERRGAPVTAFARISDKPIRIRSQIYTPDYVVVLDAALIKQVDVLYGLKDNGGILINTSKHPTEINFRKKIRKIATVNATEIAIEEGLGSKTAPIVNTAILGAFSRMSGVVGIDSIKESIFEMVPAKREENVRAAEKAYNSVRWIENE